MRSIIFLFFLVIPGILFAQDSLSLPVPKADQRVIPIQQKIDVLGNNRMLPMESYFRDRMLILAGGFCPTFPLTDRETGYFRYTANEQPRYSTVGVYLYKRELVQLSDGGNQLWATPLFDISMGKDLTADSLSRISQNTRGVRVEGMFKNRVFFTTSFYENQAILPDYARAYALSRGEFYPQGDSTYSQVNGVISGAARTKPFGDNGFDYAYAVGSITIRLTGNMEVTWGNNSLFVGSGYRSMLWSDHTPGAMNLRFRWRFNKYFDYQLVRMRGMNMMRRIGGINGEAFYEPTSLSMSTLYFHPTPNSAIGLFEGGVWYRGDSLTKKPVSPLYYIPFPGASALEETTNGKSNTVLGLDGTIKTGFALFYAQFALNPFVEKSNVLQVGTRLFNRKWKGAFVQLEYNQADENGYTSSNPRMNYASYNLPLAHPAGTNFQEFLLRGNFEYKDFFISPALHYYPKQQQQATLLPVYSMASTSSQKVILTVVEFGYKFNRAYGLECFGQFRYRKSEGTAVMESSWVSAGIRTAIRNHYFDY
jgi:hypothetical protein